MRSPKRRAIWGPPWCATTASPASAGATSGEWEVITEQGTIVAEMVVNAAGCYAREVAAMVGSDAPITNMQHHYIVTHPIPAFLERDDRDPGDARFVHLRLFPPGAEIRIDRRLREHGSARGVGAPRISRVGVLQ